MLKVHEMPLPKTVDREGKLLPPMMRNGSDAIMFSNITHFAAQRAKKNLEGDIAAQTQEICDTYDKLLAESLSDKTKITRADIFIRDKTQLEEMYVSCQLFQHLYETNLTEMNRMKVFEKWIGDAKYAPACNIMIAELLDDRVLVEVALIAVTSLDYGEEPMDPTAMEEEGGASEEVAA
jgi:enamine deaminase RidA (YjgF/YER057c/UK114 family)